jgi:adenylate cyclase
VAIQVIRLHPEYPFPYRWLAAALGQLRRFDEGNRVLEQAIGMSPKTFDLFVHNRVPWMRPEDHAHMVAGLCQVGWTDRSYPQGNAGA